MQSSRHANQNTVEISLEAPPNRATTNLALGGAGAKGAGPGMARRYGLTQVQDRETHAVQQRRRARQRLLRRQRQQQG